MDAFPLLHEKDSKRKGYLPIALQVLSLLFSINRLLRLWLPVRFTENANRIWVKGGARE